MTSAAAALECAPHARPSREQAGRDDARWRSIVAENFAPIWRFLRSLGVRDAELDDAAQQVFLVAVSRSHDITLGSERAFLFGTAVRIAQLQRRKPAKHEGLSTDDTDRICDPAPGPEDLADSKQAYEMLDLVLESMDAELRTPFVLFELEGLKMIEIASALELPLGTVASRLRRAREEFHAIGKRIRARRGAR
jgi:RNA polymerase sigma-70 factor (ECF subfamily)